MTELPFQAWTLLAGLPLGVVIMTITNAFKNWLKVDSKLVALILSCVTVAIVLLAADEWRIWQNWAVGALYALYLWAVAYGSNGAVLANQPTSDQWRAAGAKPRLVRPW